MIIIKTIMAFFGYVKIPTEVIQLSMAQEEFIETIWSVEMEPEMKEFVARHLEGQKTITAFLRSGKLISG